MINLALYGKTQEFIDYSLDQHPEKMTFITPNPQIADTLRARFDSLGRQIESITISKFIQNEFESLLPDIERENFKGKSDLILVLGAVWKKLGKDNNYIDFMRAFNLLTEFRSFSVSEHVLETVLEFYDEELASGVLWLHRFISQLGMIDEHLSYFMLAEKLREIEPPPEYETGRTLIFYGFDYMTASQVDLLKAFSLREEVIIPFYFEAYQKSTQLDWIRWFETQDTQEVALGESYTVDKENEIVHFPKNYLGKELLGLTKTQKVEAVILGNKGLNREIFFEVPLEQIKMKIPIEVFTQSFQGLSQKIEQIVRLSTTPVVDLEQFLKQESLTAIKDAHYPLLKCCTLFLNKIKEWSELSEENIEITYFDFQIIKDACFLDLPRVNLTKLDSEFNFRLGSLTDIENYKQQKIVFAMNSTYTGLKGIGSNFSENVEKYLTSIGPIRRAELDRSVLQAKFKEFVDDNQVSFLVEHGLDEEDSSVSALFSPFKFAKTDKQFDLQLPKQVYIKERKKTDLSTLSASKLQSYLDCPQKYYFQYIEKLMPQVKLKGELDPLELGQIEHKIIESYFEYGQAWDENYFLEIIEKVLGPYFSEKNITEKDSYYVEVKTYTQTTIQQLLNLRQKFQMNFQFEKPFEQIENNLNYKGFIDLFAFNNDMNMIVDFKRSNSIFSTYTAILNFEKIQLWFYLKNLMRQKILTDEKKTIIGYIDLSNFENSTFFTDSKSAMSEIKGLWGLTRVKLLDNFEDLINDYDEFENELIEKLKQEQEFLPDPLNNKVCTFCALANICPRKGSHGNT